MGGYLGIILHIIFTILILKFERGNLGPVVKNIVSLTSSLVVKMLTVLVSTISNSQYFC